MHSPVTGLFRVLLDRLLFPPSVPASKSNVRLGIPNRLSIQHCNVWSDGTLALKRLASTVPVRQQVSGVLLLRPTTRRYEIDLATIEHRKVMLSHEAQ